MRWSESRGELIAALAEAQATFGEWRKTEVAHVHSDKGDYEYAYGDLPNLLRLVRPERARRGVALIQAVEVDDRGWVLTTRLEHQSGQFVETVVPLADSYAKLVYLGTDVTYLRRYVLASLLGMSAVGEDTDAPPATEERDRPRTRATREERRGEGATPTPQTPLEELRAALRDLDLNAQVLRDFLKARDVEVDWNSRDGVAEVIERLYDGGADEVRAWAQSRTSESGAAADAPRGGGRVRPRELGDEALGFAVLGGAVIAAAGVLILGAVLSAAECVDTWRRRRCP